MQGSPSELDKYAFDITQFEMKKASKPTHTIGSNGSLQGCKSTTIVPLYFNYSDCEDGDVEDSMFQVGEETLATVFLPNQIVVVKKLLHDAQAQEFNFGPNMKIMGKWVVELEQKVQALTDN